MDELLRPNVSFDLFLRCLKEDAPSMDETELFYLDDSGQEVYCILGYLTNITPAHPYWVGYGCDLDGGAEFASAEELLSAPLFRGRSLTDRWDSVYVSTFGMVSIDAWMKGCPFAQDAAEDNGYWHL